MSLGPGSEARVISVTKLISQLFLKSYKTILLVLQNWEL